MDSTFARNLVPPGKKAIAIFTRGGKLTLQPDGTGQTGNWRLNPKRKVDLVVIYKQLPTGDGAEIVLARHTATRPSNEAGRFTVHFTHASGRGKTDLSWRVFADASQNPVRYLEAG